MDIDSCNPNITKPIQTQLDFKRIENELGLN